MTNHRTAGLFLVLAGLWGSAFVAIKAGLAAGFHPILFAAVRYDVAGVVMVAYAALVADDWLPRSRADWTTVGIAAVLMIAAYHAFLFVGEQTTSSAVAAIVVSLSPVLTAGFARAVLPGERLSIGGVVGLGLGLAGVVVLSNPDPSNLVSSTSQGVGLVFAATASFALGSVLTQRIDDALDSEALEAWAMVFGAVVMHVASIAAGEPQTIPWTAEAVFAVAYLSVGASAVGFLIYFRLLDSLGPIEINLVGYVAPVFAAAVGLLWRGEAITTPTIGGFCIVFTGFCVLKRRAIAAELRALSE
ncbi:DMT family transporter [Halobacterium salinarum]|uniref:DMT family transporter n=1 Tax=Halobacterium salinarum TaxID=2242 RepID=UPI001F185753|nr:EamA family transporter [Halobacterium salinarum]MCF2207464.1 EamA family transporter [Halobacterium salinarum]MCF2241567.1 EamA family transporter [Halobacterium salinarum]MDL0122321.1 EamA family transporter [Halobacterium salinarum]WJK63337.1 EamA family transporter [Halobacterium salinarum]